MSLDRTIVLRNDIGLDAVTAIIRSNWEVMLREGHPMAVHLYEHRDSRTKEQNSLMWVRLNEIANQAYIGGKRFSADTWHEYLKREFLPEEPGPTKSARNGYRKWDLLPNGDRVLVGSTTGLTKYGFTEYLEQIMAYAASELGVMFSAERFAA